MGTYDPSQYDEAVAACRPVRPEEYDPVRKERWDYAASVLGALPPIYPGSTFDHCSECGIEIAVGPRIQEQVERCKAIGVPIRLTCLIDAATPIPEGATANVVNLGNPYKRKP